MRNPLQSRIALVTGGASGLGKAIAQRLVSDGACVVITDIQRELGECTAKEGGFAYLPHDVTVESEWLQIVAEVEDRFGRLDVLVNNAGITGPADTADFESTQMADWHKVFSVNVDSVLLGCRAVIPAMRRSGGGSIVNVSSISAFRATPHVVAYGASKAAVRHLTRSIAQYCAQERLAIRCNSVHPGFVLTPLWERSAAGLARKRGVSMEQALTQMTADARATIPMGDFTTPADVAAAVAFLVSDDARHITGEKLTVDGGVSHCNTYRANSKKALSARGKTVDAP